MSNWSLPHTILTCLIWTCQSIPSPFCANAPKTTIKFLLTADALWPPHPLAVRNLQAVVGAGGIVVAGNADKFLRLTALQISQQIDLLCLFHYLRWDIRHTFLFEPKVTLSGVSGKFFSDHSATNSGCTADKLLLISKPPLPLWLKYMKFWLYLVVCEYPYK